MRSASLVVLLLAATARAEGNLSRLDPSAMADRLDVHELLPERDTPIPERGPLDCLARARNGKLAIETELRDVSGAVVWHVFVDARPRPRIDLERDRLVPWAQRPDPTVTTLLESLNSAPIEHETFADLISRLNVAIRRAPSASSSLEHRPVVRIQWQCEANAPWRELRFGYRDFGPASPAWQIESLVRAWAERITRPLEDHKFLDALARPRPCANSLR